MGMGMDDQVLPMGSSLFQYYSNSLPYINRLSEVQSKHYWTPNVQVQVQLVSRLDLIVSSPRKNLFKQAKVHIIWTITYKNMDKTIKTTENIKFT